MTKKHNQVCTALKYIEHLLTGCISISQVAYLAGITIEIASSAVRIKICAITSGIKKFKSIIKKTKKKHDRIALLAKTKLNSIEVLISKASVISYISHDKLFH